VDEVGQGLPLTAIDVKSLHICQTGVLISISAYCVDVSVFGFMKAAETSASWYQGAAQLDCHRVQVPLLHLRTNCIRRLLVRRAAENKDFRLATSNVNGAAEVEVFLDLTTGCFVWSKRLPTMLLT